MSAKVAIKLKKTQRGFMRGDFKDANGDACSIQESSAAEDFYLWLGCDTPQLHGTTGEWLCRMHLTQDMVRELLPLLATFVETGKLPRR